MNGPQHYAEAERLLELADAALDPATAAARAVRAQAHATLALAAATLDAALVLAPTGRLDRDRAAEWDRLTA